MAYNIVNSSQKENLLVAVDEFEKAAAVAVDISDEAYLNKKNKLIPILQEVYDLSPLDVRGKIAAGEVKVELMESFSIENRQIFEEAMGLYLIHNRSVLTDTVFLGFPFHYFYTAVFLLVLFVGLCWLFCIRTDMFHKKYGIEE
jgi:putative solute:sodium symporter small subunit